MRNCIACASVSNRFTSDCVRRCVIDCVFVSQFAGAEYDYMYTTVEVLCTQVLCSCITCVIQCNTM